MCLCINKLEQLLAMSLVNITQFSHLTIVLHQVRRISWESSRRSLRQTHRVRETRCRASALVSIVLRRSLAVILATIALAACSENTLNHSIELHNAGSKDIHELHLTYGDNALPETGPETFGINDKQTGSWQMVPPESALVQWRTDDGKAHEYRVFVEKKLDKRDYAAADFKIEFRIVGSLLEMYFTRGGQAQGRLVFSSAALQR